jgi:hypothetical protein
MIAMRPSATWWMSMRLAAGVAILACSCGQAPPPQDAQTQPRTATSAAPSNGYQRVSGPDGISFSVPVEWTTFAVPSTEQGFSIVQCGDDAAHVAKLTAMPHDGDIQSLYVRFARNFNSADAEATIRGTKDDRLHGQQVILVEVDNNSTYPLGTPTNEWHILWTENGKGYDFMCGVRAQMKSSSANACPHVLATLKTPGMAP